MTTRTPPSPVRGRHWRNQESIISSVGAPPSYMSASISVSSIGSLIASRNENASPVSGVHASSASASSPRMSRKGAAWVGALRQPRRVATAVIGRNPARSRGSSGRPCARNSTRAETSLPSGSSPNPVSVTSALNTFRDVKLISSPGACQAL
jgi:hypothetical protein